MANPSIDEGEWTDAKSWGVELLLSVFIVINPNSRKKRLNLATTKPNPITAIHVLSHARKVLSLARNCVERSPSLSSVLLWFLATRASSSSFFPLIVSHHVS